MGEAFGAPLVGDDPSGADAVDSDVGALTDSEGVGEGDDGAFAGDVCFAVGFGDDGLEAFDGGDVDDGGAGVLFEVGQGVFGGEEAASEVGIDDAVPLFEGELFDFGFEADAGVVDQGVDGAEEFDGFLDAVLDGGFLADVGGDEVDGADFAVVLDGFEAGLLVEVGDDDVHSGAEEDEGGAFADAVGAAGDEGGFAPEGHVVGFLSVSWVGCHLGAFSGMVL